MEWRQLEWNLSGESEPRTKDSSFVYVTDRLVVEFHVSPLSPSLYLTLYLPLYLSLYLSNLHFSLSLSRIYISLSLYLYLFSTPM